MSISGSPLEALKGGFRRACVKRLVGDEDGAIEVLKNEIPVLVVAWAKTSSLDPGEKKGKLKELFDDESSRADELAVAFDLFAGRFETRVASRVNDSVRGMVEKFEKIFNKLENALAQLGSVEFSVPDFPDELERPKESPIVMEEEAITEQQIMESPTNEGAVQELDPPAGLGLKFDEIEEMIDELLSSEK